MVLQIETGTVLECIDSIGLVNRGGVGCQSAERDLEIFKIFVTAREPLRCQRLDQRLVRLRPRLCVQPVSQFTWTDHPLTLG